MTKPADDYDDRLEQFAQAVMQSAGEQGIGWLDVIFVFGITTRALIECAPARIQDAEQQALNAFATGLSGQGDPDISPPTER